MNDLISCVNTFYQLKEVLEHIYESRRLIKQGTLPFNSLAQILKESHDSQLKEEVPLQCLTAIDALMLLLKEYQEDLFGRGSLKDVETYKLYQEQYITFQKRLKTNIPQVNNVEIKSFQQKLETFLALVIQSTQLHLIFLDSQPQIQQAKNICNTFLDVSDLDNVQISFYSMYAFEKVLHMHKNIPSIYVFLGDCDESGEMSDILSSKLSKITTLKNKTLIKKCFVTDIKATDSFRKTLSNHPLISFVDDISRLYLVIRNFIEQVSEIQTLQFLPISDSTKMRNTLSFLEKYSNINSKEQDNLLMELGRKLFQTYNSFYVRSQNKNTSIFRCLESIFKCFQKDNQIQRLSKKILQNFVEIRHVINQCISRQLAEEMIQYEDLISTVFLAFQIYIEEQSLEFYLYDRKIPIYTALVVEHEDLSYFQKGNKIMLPSFTYFYLRQSESLDSVEQLPQKQNQPVILEYQFDDNRKQKSPFKRFRTKNGLTTIMSMPTEEFTIIKTSKDTQLNCTIVHFT